MVPVALMVGSTVALFLWLLEAATHFRFAHEWLLYLLPVAGMGLGVLYQGIGKPAAGGNNLILEQIHAPGGGIPKRMAPLILMATVLTHLFGGSAGREGTAVQIGGSIASGLARFYPRWLRHDPVHLRLLLMAGVAAGFGSVFGTPLTGSIFAMEVLALGRIRYEALIPTLIASVVADATCSAWGIRHTAYHIDLGAGVVHSIFDPLLLAKVAAGGVAFGLAAFLFSELTHRLEHFFKRKIRWAPARPFVGGVLVIALVGLVGSRDFLGLGVDAAHPGAVTLVSAFAPGGAHAWSWWWKLLFTAVTLSCGFKGGEVTPLFFIGATLGNTLAWIFGAPVDLFAGIGFIAVFGAAANTPLACTVMGMELFGAHYAVCFAVACFIAYYFSGHSGIYLSQRIGVPKYPGGFGNPELPGEISLRELRHDRKA